MSVEVLVPVLWFVVVALPFLLSFAAVLVRPAGLSPAAGVERLRVVSRTTTRWRWAGLAAGAVGAGFVVSSDVLGRGPMLAVPVLALGVLVGVVVGELRVEPPAGPTRTASLEVRTVRSYLPRVLTPVVGVLVVALAGLLAFASAVASPDDQGRAGRALSRSCTSLRDGGAFASSASSGPWPGSFYAVPLAAVLLGGLLAAGFALRRVVHRPRQGEDVALDDALRRNASAAVVAAVGVLVAVPLAGASLVSAFSLHGMPCTPAAWQALVPVLGVLVPVALVVAGWCAWVLVRPLRLPVAAPGSLDDVAVAG